MHPELSAALEAARDGGDLLPASHENLVEQLDGSDDPVDEASVRFLVNEGHWRELNNRFFKKLAFVTSGLRGSAELEACGMVAGNR
jgi:phosphoglucomutase